MWVGCTSSESGLITTEASASGTAESIRDEVISLLEATDVAGLDALLPAESWERVRSLALDGFSPSGESGGCEEVSDTTQECFIFDQDAPFVLELTVSLQGSEWRPTAVSFDSTD